MQIFILSIQDCDSRDHSIQDRESDLRLSFLLAVSVCVCVAGASATTFTFINKCQYTVWPGILSGAGRPNLETTGFVLPSGASRSLPSPAGWSGRFWGRTGCNFDQSGHGSCATADCGSGQVECNGAGAAPPATLAEFTLNGDSSQDFYDVSLVDGYNLPMVVEASGGSGVCGSTGCVVDINQRCPAELRAGDGGACKSACDAFGSPEYCCSGAYNSAAACKPSVYAQLFKSACPRSYSYAYDDATSTFTCSAADYAITFCPSLPSQKSTMDTPIGSGDGSGSGVVTEPESGSGSGPGALFAGGGPSWMANLATATSDGSHPAFAVEFWILIIGYVILCLIK
ncbi:Thaumatin-like protein 1, variant 2 [Dionaea muscipula]